MSWCSPRVRETHTVHNFRALFHLAEKMPVVRLGMASLCESAPKQKGVILTTVRNGVTPSHQGSRQKACAAGFASGFVSAIITGQRLEGLDKEQVPIVYHRIRTGNSTRRHRIVWIRGGSKDFRREQVRKTCAAVYADSPELAESHCLAHIDWSIQDHHRAVLPLPVNGGDRAGLQKNYSILSQQIEISRQVEQREVISAATVYRLQNETSQQCAVRNCEVEMEGLISPTHRPACVELLTSAMRLEEEITSDIDRARARQL